CRKRILKTQKIKEVQPPRRITIRPRIPSREEVLIAQEVKEVQITAPVAIRKTTRAVRHIHNQSPPVVPCEVRDAIGDRRFLASSPIPPNQARRRWISDVNNRDAADEYA